MTHMETKLVWTSAALGGAAVVLFLVWSMRTRSKDRLPPSGPYIPVVGSLLYLGADPIKPLSHLQKKLGDVFTVYFGSKPVVVLNTYDSMKEAFVKQGNAFSGRPQDTFLVENITKGYGVVLTEGHLWQEQRKFSHAVLQELGMGSSVMEEKIHEELRPFLEHIQNMSGNPLNIAKPLQMAVSNIMCSIIFGHRREYSNPAFLKFNGMLDDVFRTLNLGGALTVFPWLLRIPGDPFGIKKNLKIFHCIFDYYRSQIKEHQKTYDQEKISDLIYSFLKAMKYQQSLGNNNTSFHEDQLVMLTADLFSAGTETTSTTLNWAIIYLLHYPDIQAKVQDEIIDLMGAEQLPRMSDRPHLPYTEATLLEVQRMASATPFTIAHTTTEKVRYRYYTLPCGTMVIGNLHAAHHDPNVWPDPYKFDPTRFLDSDGKITNYEKLIPFSMGKRACLGESLARNELFLFFTAMLQQFTFKLPEGHPLPDLVGKFGVIRSVNPYIVKIEPVR